MKSACFHEQGYKIRWKIYQLFDFLFVFHGIETNSPHGLKARRYHNPFLYEGFSFDFAVENQATKACGTGSGRWLLESADGWNYSKECFVKCQVKSARKKNHHDSNRHIFPWNVYTPFHAQDGRRGGQHSWKMVCSNFSSCGATHAANMTPQNISHGNKSPENH